MSKLAVFILFFGMLLHAEGFLPNKCVEKTFVKNSIKYVTSFDETGNPCKIYDLSIPTARTMLSLLVEAIPLQEFTTSEYTDWVTGKETTVYGSIKRYNTNFSRSSFSTSWVSKLDFKDKRRGYITNFRLSDLNLGNFSFTPQERQELKKLMALTNSWDKNLADIVNDPQKLLSKISFNWNDAKKAFDVYLDFDFLPLNKPVALVDYNIQYKYIVEQQVRHLLFRLLAIPTSYIPEFFTRNLVKIVLSDTSEFIDMMYEAHMNYLEDTLKMNLQNSVYTPISKQDLEKGLNILFAQRSSLITEYILSQVTGQSFSFVELDKIGKKVRYDAEKSKEILVSQQFSDLTLNSSCSMELYFGYFGICTKNNESYALYNLISDWKLLIWSMGAPAVMYYQHPYYVSIKRYTSWLLSAAARMFDIPYVPSFIETQLSSELKNIATVGMQEEALLLNHLTELKRDTKYISRFDQQHIDALYIQNINPFMIKSEKLEDSVISKNYNILVGGN